jgi:antirestriction protein ArdC
VCGIANTTRATSAAYLQSWMQVLRHDPTLLVHAAAQAQRAAEYIQHLLPDTGTVRAGDDHTPTHAVPTP